MYRKLYTKKLGENTVQRIICSKLGDILLNYVLQVG